MSVDTNAKYTAVKGMPSSATMVDIRLGVVGTAGTLCFPTVADRDTVIPELLGRMTFT
jgi:hypothetical protein